jgi:hypothetical protein
LFCLWVYMYVCTSFFFVLLVWFVDAWINRYIHMLCHADTHKTDTTNKSTPPKNSAAFQQAEGLRPPIEGENIAPPAVSGHPCSCLSSLPGAHAHAQGQQMMLGLSSPRLSYPPPTNDTINPNTQTPNHRWPS